MKYVLYHIAIITKSYDSCALVSGQKETQSLHKKRPKSPKSHKKNSIQAMEQHKSIEFNNAGCEMLSLGRVQEAHELFRAALLCHMDGKNLAIPRGGWVTPTERTESEDGRSNGGLASAQELEEGIQDCMPVQPSASSSATEAMASALSSQIHKQAFPIHQANPSIIDPSAAAIHVFNLGLVHHLLENASWKAKSFYELSALMLALNPTCTNTIEEDPRNDLRLSLHEAIINNLRICLVESGELTMSAADFGGTEPAHQIEQEDE